MKSAWDDSGCNNPAGPLIPSPLPLFPLSSVLFPGGLLPLRIFEVRYLDLIGQCQREGKPFGVVALHQGSEVRRAGAPAEEFLQVGTLAHLRTVERPQPGLMHIVSEGGTRFRIQSARQLPHGLWTADVQALPDDAPVPVPDDLRQVATALEQLLDSWRARAIPEDQWPLRAPWRWDDCSWLSNRWCELLPLPPTVKQQLMELDNPLVRLELVGDLLARHDKA
ncbi:LON peptidase substrate-binding domain-containing protein [Pseudorhodoferax sp. Leaf274]|uniref:LON peptidase substrate-binding domain-containing protein n=1 Tax=Pseudorhodoferax sp. Leaf274 TaxID=1736318 RepID=UPI000702A5F9|nr:LON peptidase substrate-binding domain-containing protein [Pseudorhodoferax sp. Leaf274]KQP35803.1 peptidase S16 [Pseudorhodoferax sp. Leaf274]